MERDFMGLNPQDCIAVKEELVEGGCEEPAFMSSSRVPSMEPEQDEKPFKLEFIGGNPPNSQLTIFYNGTVNVFDHISPEKARAIIFLAGNGRVVDTSATRMIPSIAASANAMMSSAIPQARKASLARFLEKRRERVMNASPYMMNKKPNDCGTPDSVGCGFSSTGNGSTDINGDC